MIRLATAADVPAILEIYTPYVENTTNSFEYVAPTLEAFHARFAKITAQFPWLVWEENGTVLGYAYGSLPFQRAAYQWSCSVSIYLAPQAQKKGIGRKLYTALEHLLFQQGYRTIYAVVTSENQDSLNFHLHMGYEKVAEMPEIGMKFGRWLGTIWLQKRQNSVEIPQSPPTDFPVVVESDKKLSEFLEAFTLS